MLFTTIDYLIFLPIVFIIYWLTRADKRWIVLLVASYFFYANWNVKYVGLIFSVTLVSYMCARLIQRSRDTLSVSSDVSGFGTTPNAISDEIEISESETRVGRRTGGVYVLICALLVFGALVYFKYFNFILDTINGISALFGSDRKFDFINVILPVGISFYIFQAFSYVIDVYRGDVEAEKNFGYFALFISFFPQLVAGPIERTANLLPQLKSEKQFNYTLAVYGLRLMLWGYFKKLIIADRVAYYTDIIFGSYPEFKGFTLLTGMFFFTIQIYCDFSGYSDIAIGSANLLGIRLMTNFKSPYFSSSVKEFFSRWHISLSSWFKDYVYIPLGGNRCSKARHIFNVMVTMLVSGLWHGAAWTYVAWGGIHGIGNVLNFGSRKKAKSSGEGNVVSDAKVQVSDEKHKSGSRRNLVWWLKVLGTFIFCMFAWTFFRAFDFKCAFTILSKVFSGITSPAAYFIDGYKIIGIGLQETILIAVCLLALAVYDYISLDNDVLLLLDKLPRAVRYAIYIALTIIIIYFIPTHGNNEFIYFQF